MKQFYTYLHCKPNGEPFYIGKGCGTRSHNLASRNNHHKNIVAKYGKENIKIFVFLCESEAEAVRDEIIQIKQLREDGYILTNVTDGGDGMSGFKLDEETRNKMSLAAKKRWENPERIKQHSDSQKGNKNRLGHKFSKEAIDKLCIAARNRDPSCYFNKRKNNGIL